MFFLTWLCKIASLVHTNDLHYISTRQDFLLVTLQLWRWYISSPVTTPKQASTMVSSQLSFQCCPSPCLSLLILRSNSLSQFHFPWILTCAEIKLSLVFLWPNFVIAGSLPPDSPAWQSACKVHVAGWRAFLEDRLLAKGQNEVLLHTCLRHVVTWRVTSRLWSSVSFSTKRGY